MTYLEKIIDFTTGEETIREYTQEEIEAAKKIQNKLEQKLQADADLLDAKLATLQKLGLTEPEAKLLLS